MEKKVDLSALVGGDQRNSMVERAPLAPGYEEKGPYAEGVKAPTFPTSEVVDPQDAPSKENTKAPAVMDVSHVPYSAFDTEANRSDRGDALVSVDEDGKPSGVLVGSTVGQELVKATEEAKAITMDDQPATKVEVLMQLIKAQADQMTALTKRLEDFGAIPKAVSDKAPEPVVTTTPAGNVRTDL